MENEHGKHEQPPEDQKEDQKENQDEAPKVSPKGGTSSPPGPPDDD